MITKIYKDIIPELNATIDLKISLTNKNEILSNFMLINDSKSIIKNNLYKLMEYSNSLENLKQLSANNDTINTHFNILWGTVIISIGLLIIVSLYFKLKNKYCKNKGSVEETIVNKTYESVNTQTRESPLPRII